MQAGAHGRLAAVDIGGFGRIGDEDTVDAGLEAGVVADPATSYLGYLGGDWKMPARASVRSVSVLLIMTKSVSNLA
jgi:hypothetical protein